MPEKTSDQKPAKEYLPEDQVRLRAVLGIKPGHYLAVLYGLIILVILFFILVYPGLSNPGTLLKVKSEPEGAAVRVDGVYQNAAPCDIFVPAGKHSIEVAMPGFTEWQSEMEFGGSVFASVFFPRKQFLKAELRAPNPLNAFIKEAAEYAAWTFADEATAAYQIPMVLSEGAYRLGPEASDPALRPGLDQVLAASARFAVTRSALRDLLRAKFLLDNQGLCPSPLTLPGSAEDIINFLNNNPEAAAWLAETLQGEAVSLLNASSWYKNNTGSLINFLPERTISEKTETILGMKFKEINYAKQDGSPERFYMAEDLVSIDLWEQFLDQRPKWQKQNREALIKEGLANSLYLDSPEIPGFPEDIVSGVSWYAASAFCEWFNTRLPPEWKLWELRLPKETEWELGTGLDRAGEFWEWCYEPFAPLDFLLPPAADYDPGSPERPVRGGSWINPPRTVDTKTRGSLPPESCSPFVSFRPVLSPKETAPQSRN